jgi:hypothetical protein
MLTLLVFPFLFFSNLRYISNTNPITDATLGITINIQQRIDQDLPPMNYEFPLYQTSSPLRITNMNESYFKHKNYDARPETKFFDVN